MLIKPYAKLAIEYQCDNSILYYYRITRYNSINEDWEILDGVYYNEEEVQKVIDEYNQETGLVKLAP